MKQISETTRKLAAGEYERASYDGTCKRHLQLKRWQAELLGFKDRDTIIMDGDRLIIQVEGLWEDGDAENTQETDTDITQTD
jgi:hypothetical protein